LGGNWIPAVADSLNWNFVVSLGSFRPIRG